MQISRFTASKPSKFAFASDEKSIRQPTTSFVRCYLYFRRILHGHQGIILIPLNLLHWLGFSRYCQTELLFWKYTMFFHCQSCLDRKEIRVHHHHGKHKDVRIHCCSMCPARRMGLAAHSIRGGRRCHPRILHSRFAVACNYRSRRRTGIFARPLRPLRVLRRNRPPMQVLA